MVRTESPRLSRRTLLIGGIAFLLIAFLGFLTFFSTSNQTHAAVTWTPQPQVPTNGLMATLDFPQTLINPVTGHTVVLGFFSSDNPNSNPISFSATGGVFFFSSHDNYSSYVEVNSWPNGGVSYPNFSGAFDRRGDLHIVYSRSNRLYYVKYNWNGSSYVEAPSSRIQIMNNVCGALICEYVSLTTSLYPNAPDKLYLAYSAKTGKNYGDTWRIDVTETSALSPNWGNDPINNGNSGVGVSPTDTTFFRYPNMVADKDGNLFLAYRCGEDYSVTSTGTKFPCHKTIARIGGAWGPIYSYNLESLSPWPGIGVDNKGNAFVFAGKTCVSMIKYDKTTGWSGSAGNTVNPINNPTRSCVTGTLNVVNPNNYDNLIKYYSAVSTGDGSVYVAFQVNVRGVFYLYTSDSGVTFGPGDVNSSVADSSTNIDRASIGWYNNQLTIAGKKVTTSGGFRFYISRVTGAGGGYFDAAPSNLTFSNVTNSSLTLSWQNNSPNATSIKVERRPYPAGGTWTSVTGSPFTGNTKTSFDDTSLSEGTGYEYQVTALGAPAGDLVSSSAHQFTVLNAPSNLQPVTSTASSITVGWTDNSTHNTGYIVERSTLTSPPVFSQIGPSQSDVTSYPDSALAGGCCFLYRVKAYETAPSSTEGTIYSDYSNIVYSEIAPTAPNNVIAASRGSSQELVQWTDNSTFEDGYRIIFQIGASPVLTFSVGPLAGTGATDSFLATGLAANTNYNIQIQGFSSGNGTASGSVAATTAFAPPTAVNFTSVTGTTLTVNWTAPSGSPSSYVVERMQVGVSSGWAEVSNPASRPTTTTFSDTGLTAGKLYLYRVKAINSSLVRASAPTSDGASDPSPQAGVLTTPGATPWVVSVGTDDGTGNTANTLSWAIAQANGSATNKIITFSVTKVTITSPTAAFATVNQGTTIVGSCSTGPGVELDGNGVLLPGSMQLDGLKLNGVTLFGLYVHHFTGREIVANAGRDVMTCVKTGKS